MQDGYVGDVGDFGKYLLLWNIYSPDESDNKSLRLGVNWYRIKEKKSTGNESDGKHIGYLIKDNFNLQHCCNPYSQKLYEKLDKILFKNLEHVKQKFKKIPISKWNVECKEELKQISGNRKVEEIEKNEILPRNTVFYGENLLQNIDRQKRQKWVYEGFKRLRGCDIIFFDPDNGLKDDMDSNNNSVKHIYFRELENYCKAGKSLVIYHHLKWDEAGLTQVKNIRCKLYELNEKFNNSSEIIALWYHRGTARIFFIISNGEHKKIINERIDKFVANFDDKKSNKERHFQKI